LEALTPRELDRTIAYTRRHLTQLIRARPSDGVYVLPGYLASTLRGRLTTLGRNGSDCSAALVGVALNARAVTLNSDVRGVFRADPRLVSDAPILPALSYEQALAIARRGADVVHAGSVAALAHARIPLDLRGALTPQLPGTWISDGPASFTARDALLLPRSRRLTPAEDREWSVLTVHPLAPPDVADLRWLAETVTHAIAGSPHIAVTRTTDGAAIVRMPQDYLTSVTRALAAALGIGLDARDRISSACS
jgi:aspartokinase